MRGRRLSAVRAAGGVARAPRAGGPRAAWTLVELLVSLALVALLVALLVPALGRARRAARIVSAHAELRQIELALQMYADTNGGALPPTRFSCSLRAAYELPIELGRQRYLPHGRKLVENEAGQGLVEAVQMRDVFNPGQTYKYRAVGAALMNETTLLEPPQGAALWVPDGFPDCSAATGRYYYDPRESPVRYAVWSVGPDPDAPKLRHTPGRQPLPRRYWCRGSADTGVITHFQGRDGRAYMSP